MVGVSAPIHSRQNERTRKGASRDSIQKRLRDASSRLKEWRQRAPVRASRRSLSVNPLARKTPTCLSRPPEARCGRVRGCGKRRARFRRGGLRRLRPQTDPLRLRSGLRRRRRRTRPRAFSAASRRTTPRTRGRSWTGSCFVSRRACRDGEERETGVSATKRSRGDQDAGEIWGRGEGGHAQRGDEVHDAPEDVGDYAQPVRRAAAHDRAVAHVRHGSSSLDRAARLEL